MALDVIGQRCISEPEPELGLGIVLNVENFQVGVHFPKSGEQRIYAKGTSVLKRITFKVGESVLFGEDESLTIEEVEEIDGLLYYISGSLRICENEISDMKSFSMPQDRFMKGKVDSCDTFELRLETLYEQLDRRQSAVRGYLGGRIDLIPHQLCILDEVAKRQIPRVLLADEVGLGKTIEACLILQRLLAVRKVKRALILLPESLTHQWFVELIRRFNLWFSIFDDERCNALERSNPGENPFLDEQLILCSLSFLSSNEIRREQAIEAGWDILIVDEAHHLDWTPEKASDDYSLVEAIAEKTPGVLLLTATPTQLGLEGHFARLRLLDPDRYSNYDLYKEEAENYTLIAPIAGKIIDKKSLNSKDESCLKKIFSNDPERLEGLLTQLKDKKKGARQKLLKALLDEHGLGRVIFRNTRSNMTGFPERKYCPVPIETDNKALLQRFTKVLAAEEEGTEDSLRYAFGEDPRVDWLVDFLKENREEKVLLICKSQRKVIAIETALQAKMNVKAAMFHEGLPLVNRDRNAAWFAEEDGARILICSEIGSEGRNFQFVHNLILFDLPSKPGLLEQRIGRLDRIGQKQTIKIHVPYLVGSCIEFVANWYHKGLDSIEHSLHGGDEFLAEHKKKLVELALNTGELKTASLKKERNQFIKETSEFRKDLSVKLREGRDRLLELNSFDANKAEEIVSKIREVESSGHREFLCKLLDYFGVRITEHDENDLFLDPSHAYIEAFPGLSNDGMLATFERSRAIAREDIHFISKDHELFTESMDLLVNSKQGTTAIGCIESDSMNILLELVFVLEVVAQTEWHVEEFLAPTPIRLLLDIRGNDLSDQLDDPEFMSSIKDGDIHRFLENPGFNDAILKAMVEGGSEMAESAGDDLRTQAKEKATKALKSEVQRLVDLRKINDHVRVEEIELAQEQLDHTIDAIEHARIRIDSLRLIVCGG